MDRKLLVIGSGGHARSVLDIVLQNNDYSFIGCISPEYPKRKFVSLLEDVPIIGTDEELPALFNAGYRDIFIALGDNHLRHKIYQQVIALGFTPVNIISRHAVLSPRIKLGKGICIMPGAVLNINVQIGDNCIINTKCSLDHDCTVNASCHIAPGVSISGFVEIGEGSHIGTGSSVIDKITIGSWCLIGGGSAVVKNIDSGWLAYGVPAKKIKAITKD